MLLLGLIGFPLEHSFSPAYFKEKFAKEGIFNYDYQAFPIAAIEEFPSLVKQHQNLVGLNVTIPYKSAVMPYLTDIQNDAKSIGAVNTIKINGNERIGYNTDYRGFQKSLTRLLHDNPYYPSLSALILGNGGSSKSVQFVLKSMGIPYQIVSRSNDDYSIDYEDITPDILHTHFLIINTTPLGMYQHLKDCPPIPYSELTPRHLLFDLIYNPAETLFLRKGREKGCITKNGYEMLLLQAEFSWKIWTE